MSATNECKWCGKSFRIYLREELEYRSFPGYSNPMSLWCCEKCLYEWEVANKCVGLKAEEYKKWASNYEDARQKYKKRKEEHERESKIRQYETGKGEITRQSIVLTIVCGFLPCCVGFFYGVTTKGLPTVYDAVINLFKHGKVLDDSFYVLGPTTCLVVSAFMWLVRFMLFNLFYKPKHYGKKHNPEPTSQQGIML